MISQTLQQLIGESMKAKNFLRTETLRMLSSAFNYERIALQHDLTEEEELKVIQKEAKQRRDSIETFQKLEGSDSPKIQESIEKEKAELAILQEFLPPEMSDEELDKLVSEAVDQVGAKTMADIGKVIGLVKSKAPNVDGGKIAAIVKTKI
jgi:uncharacterized protein